MRARSVLSAVAAAISMAVGAQPLPSTLPDSAAAVSQPSTLLYVQDQGCASGATGSNEFNVVAAAYSSELADDVTVPAADNWSVTRVFARGKYTAGTTPTTAVNVRFYGDATGKPEATPIAACEYTDVASFTDIAGALAIDLPSACALAGGAQGTRYWLSVQTQLIYDTSHFWGWRDRIQTGSPAYWRNPGNGYAVGCTAWLQRTSCVPYDLGAPDACFALRGASEEIVFRDSFEDD